MLDVRTLEDEVKLIIVQNLGTVNHERLDKNMRSTKIGEKLYISINIVL